MNNNVRGVRSTSQNQPSGNSGIGTRHSSISAQNNNIHININLNVKKKSSCHHAAVTAGKKINNYIEITDPKNQIKGNGSGLIQEGQSNFNQVLKSSAIDRNKLVFNVKQDQNAKREQKIKKKRTKQKMVSKPYTPQKPKKGQSQQKSIQRSKTGKKLLKKKQSRSMQNMKVLKQRILSNHGQRKFHEIQNNKRNQHKSNSNSNSKSRQKQKSGNKLKKNRTSSKNITTFQNSGIKRILISQKQTGKSHMSQHLRKSKKSLKSTKIAEEDLNILNEFVQEKKRKDHNDRKKKQKESTMKSIKIKDELLKADKQKHRFITKTSKKYGQQVSAPKEGSRFPIFFGQHQQFDQSYDQFRKLKKQNFSGSNQFFKKTPEKQRFHSKNPSPQNSKKLSNKMNKIGSNIDKHQRHKLSRQESRDLQQKVIKIQAYWRGYNARKTVYQQIYKMHRIAFQKKQKILKNSNFWNNDEQDNSILDLQFQDSHTAKKKHPRSKHNELQQAIRQRSGVQKSPGMSNYNSSSHTSQNQTNHKKYLSQSGKQSQLQKGQINVRMLDLNKSVNQAKRQEGFQKTNMLAVQIQVLKKEMLQQNNRFLELQKQNNHLKQNLRNIVQKQKNQNVRNVMTLQTNAIKDSKQVLYPSEQSKPSSAQVKENDGQFHDSRNYDFSDMLQPSNERLKMSGKQKFKNLKIDTTIEIDFNYEIVANTYTQLVQSPSHPYVQNLKRQLQSFQSPSNRSLQNLSSSSLTNLQNMFKKKELSVDQAYQKNSKTYRQMLQSNIVSPKTYNFKKIELDLKYKKQKQQISSNFKEAQKVIKFISQEIVQEQNVGEDQSPLKQKSEEQDYKIGAKEQGYKIGAKEQGYQHVSGKIGASVTESSRDKDVQRQLSRQTQSYENQEGNLRCEQNFRKYWTDDIEEVHKKVLQISSRIDQALQADSKQSQSYRSQSNKQLRSQDSNFNNSQGLADQVQDKAKHNRSRSEDGVKTNIYQESEYIIQQELRPDQAQQPNSVMNNNSNLSSSSDKSNLSALYDIHYPSSPQNKDVLRQEHRHVLELKDQTQGNVQNQIEANHSGFSQNKSQVSEKSAHSSVVKQSRGFDTRLTFIKEYCIALCEFVRSQWELKKQFMENISSPLKFDYFQYLKSYRTTLNNQNDTRYNSTSQDYIYPYFKRISGPTIQKALNQFNSSKFKQLYDQSYDIAKELTTQMLQLRTFFIQAIIDVFNQSLDFERPGSIYGQPLPWLVQSKNLKNNHVKLLRYLGNSRFNNNQLEQHSQNEDTQNQQDERLDKIFGVAIAKIIQWGSCLCGFIPEPVSFDNQDAQSVNIDQEQTNLVRQTRLAYMLQKSLAQEEQRMVDSTMEQLQVQLQAQQLVFHQLIEQIAMEIIQFNSNNPSFERK